MTAPHTHGGRDAPECRTCQYTVVPCSECQRPRSTDPESEEGMSGMCLRCLNGDLTAAGRARSWAPGDGQQTVRDHRSLGFDPAGRLVILENLLRARAAGSVPVATPHPVGMNAPNGEPLTAVPLPARAEPIDLAECNHPWATGPHTYTTAAQWPQIVGHCAGPEAVAEPSVGTGTPAEAGPPASVAQERHELACTRWVSSSSDDEDVSACGNPAVGLARTTSGTWEPICARHCDGLRTEDVQFFESAGEVSGGSGHAERQEPAKPWSEMTDRERLLAQLDAATRRVGRS